MFDVLADGCRAGLDVVEVHGEGEREAHDEVECLVFLILAVVA
jgi:hypothetical protein